jgi:hypothetical protein
VRSLSTRLRAAEAAIDAANGEDPTVITVRGEQLPLALAHGRLAADWVEQLHPGADETWLLAARAHHLRRWQVPRQTYPAGRAGYLKWRRDQKARHATDVAELLVAAGYDAASIARVQQIIRRDRLATDAAMQALEDAASLVFIETQLAAVAKTMDHDLLIDVLRKTARKLSSTGAAAIPSIPLGAAERALLAEAFRAE